VITTIQFNLYTHCSRESSVGSLLTQHIR
jgi:hypothetical protein